MSTGTLRTSSEYTVERPCHVYRSENSFFDSLRPHFMRDLRFLGFDMGMPSVMDHHFDMMRSRMFQLSPFDPFVHIRPANPFLNMNGETKLKLDFNVNAFKPEEIEVNVVGENQLQVVATRSKKSGHMECKRQYITQYTLPEGVVVDNIKPVISRDGVLTIEAPAPNVKVEVKQVEADKQ